MREINAAEVRWKAERAKELKDLMAAKKKRGGIRRGSVVSTAETPTPRTGPKDMWGRSPHGGKPLSSPVMSVRPTKKWAKLKALTQTVGMIRTATSEGRAAREAARWAGDSGPSVPSAAGEAGGKSAPLVTAKNGERERYLGQDDGEEGRGRSSDEESDRGEFGDHETIDEEDDFFG